MQVTKDLSFTKVSHYRKLCFYGSYSNKNCSFSIVEELMGCWSWIDTIMTERKNAVIF